MTTIRIADDGPHPRRTEFAEETNIAAREHSIYNLKPLSRSRTTLSDDGIVNIRSRTQPSFRSRRFSIGSKDGTDDDEDPDLRRASDFKHKQVRMRAAIETDRN